MRLDGITPDEVEFCLDGPDESIPQAKGRTRYRRSIEGDNVINVVAKPEGEDVIIITAFLDKRRGRRG